MLSEVYLLERTDTTLPPVVVVPYATNGPISPSDGGLDPGATEASTALTFVGEGKHDYGNIIQQNLLYLLENFANNEPPVNPLVGQLWYNKADNNGGMFFWDGNQWKMLNSLDDGVLVVGDLNMSGHLIHNLGYPQNPNDAVSKRYVDDSFILKTGDDVHGNIKFAGGVEVYGLPINISSNLNTSGSVKFGNTVLLNETEMMVSNRSKVTYDTGSSLVLKDTVDVDFGSNVVTNIGDPLMDGDAVNLRYLVDELTGYAKLSGATFVGPVILTEDSEASANFTMSDAKLTGTMLVEHGGTVEIGDIVATVNASGKGTITLNNDSLLDVKNGTVKLGELVTFDAGNARLRGVGTPIDPMDSATKKYVDDLTDSISSTIGNYVSKSGDEMTGLLTIRGGIRVDGGIVDINNAKLTNLQDPTNPLDAVNVRYLEGELVNIQSDLNDVVSKSGDSMTGTLEIQSGGLRVLGGNVSFGQLPIKDVAMPIDDEDATNKRYVDDSVNDVGLTIDQKINDVKDTMDMKYLSVTGGLVDGDVEFANGEFKLTNMEINIDSDNTINIDFGSY